MARMAKMHEEMMKHMMQHKQMGKESHVAVSDDEGHERKPADGTNMTEAQMMERCQE